MQNSAQFFENRECKFFPCHKGLREGEFNCLGLHDFYAKNACGLSAFVLPLESRNRAVVLGLVQINHLGEYVPEIIPPPLCFSLRGLLSVFLLSSKSSSVRFKNSL